MAELPPYTIREYRPGDEGAILETFNRVFAAVEEDFTPRSLESWRWLYLQNPAGWRIYLAVLEDGTVISQYAGIGQDVLLEGRPARFSQAIDSMTDPAWRGGLKRPGFFVLTGYPYAENYGGPPPDRDTVMWGLPVPPAWRIGKAYLEYELVRTQLKLVADPARVRLRASGGVSVEESGAFPEEVGALFARAAGAHGAIAVRSAEHLAWRFGSHPERRYRIGLARGGDGALRGYAVYRRGPFDGSEDGLVCDWLVPAGDGVAAEALRGWLVDCARGDGSERLTAVFPDTCAEWLDFQRAGFRVQPTRYFLVGRNYVEKYTMNWLYHNWYYTAGDTDLC